jgi:hypothetical protein
MFPLVNANMFNPDDWCDAVTGDPDCTVAEKRAILDGIFSEDPAGIFNSAACLLHAEVDGVSAVYSAPIVRTQSPPHEYGGDFESVADGVWVVLPQSHLVSFSWEYYTWHSIAEVNLTAPLCILEGIRALHHNPFFLLVAHTSS